jgi:arylsulfatase A-like enzyme
MAEASKTTWFKNTLFVFVADHGRDLGYPETQFDRPGHFHIPLFFWGPALHPILSGKSSVKVASQCDIAETLNQSLLFNKKKQFDYAANLLNNNRHSPSVYIFNSGFGVVAEDGEVVFHNQPRQKTLSRGREKLCDSLLSLGQVFQYRQIVNYMKN